MEKQEGGKGYTWIQGMTLEELVIYCFPFNISHAILINYKSSKPDLHHLAHLLLKYLAKSDCLSSF
jgi:hypothetical protein